MLIKKTFVLYFIFAIVSISCLGIGRYDINVFEAFNYAFGNVKDENLELILGTIRLPRIILAILVGACLSFSGLIFQSVFKNPLATPDTLGVVSGACFGAVLGIILGFNFIFIQLISFVCGLLSLALSYFISKASKEHSILMIILAGIIISSIFSSLIALIKYVADAEEMLPTITFWLLGSLSGASYENILLSLPFMLISIVVLFFYRFKINVLILNDDEIKSLGVNLARMRIILLLSATMLAASSVCMCGAIGWIGLLIPHLARIIFGVSGQNLFFTTPILGSIVLVIIDTIARSVSDSELPISILSALIGAPLFIAILCKKNGFRI